METVVRYKFWKSKLQKMKARDFSKTVQEIPRKRRLLRLPLRPRDGSGFKESSSRKDGKSRLCLNMVGKLRGRLWFSRTERRNMERTRVEPLVVAD
jgi:hypothetical protein